MNAQEIVDTLLEAVIDVDAEVDELVKAAVQSRKETLRIMRANKITDQHKIAQSVANRIATNPVWMKHHAFISYGPNTDAEVSKGYGGFYARKEGQRGRIVLFLRQIGAFILRGEPEAIAHVLRHELIHREQHRREGYSLKVAKQSEEFKKYWNDPQEIMAHTRDFVENMYRDRTKAELLKELRTNGLKNASYGTNKEWTPENYKRALNYAYQYAQNLPDRTSSVMQKRKQDQDDSAKRNPYQSWK